MVGDAAMGANPRRDGTLTVVARLHWGCGPVIAPGWTNSDIVDYGQEHVGDVLDGLPWPDATFEGIVANHALQALPIDAARRAMVELARVLQPGGVLRVLVPDVVAAFRAYEGRERWWPGFAAIAEPLGFDEKFCRYVTWSGTNRSVWTWQTLADAFDAAGLAPFFSWRQTRSVGAAWIRDLDTREGESLVGEGVKDTSGE